MSRPNVQIAGRFLSLAACVLAGLPAAGALFAAGRPAASKAPSTPEALLRALAGTWNATLQIATPDDSPPQIINALEVNRLGGDGGWLVSDFASQLEGRAFEGHAILAYDPADGKFRRVWADVTAPTAWRSEGTWDPATRTLTMWIETVDSSGTPVRWREETIFKDDASRTFTMYAPGAEATEAAPITIAYRRRAEGAPPRPYRPAATPPSPEHALLARDAGTWNARLEAEKGSPLDPGIDKAVATDTLCCDGLFLVSDLVGSRKKRHYEGHGITGYDPGTKKYWSAWVDSLDRRLDLVEGTWDEASATLTFPLAGAAAGRGAVRETLVHRPDGGRTLTIWSRGRDGREIPGLVIEAERAKVKGAAPKPTAAER